MSKLAHSNAETMALIEAGDDYLVDDEPPAPTHNGRVIKTSFQYPPIPDRRFDWLAYFDGDEEGHQGWGRTEAEAIADLADNNEA